MLITDIQFTRARALAAAHGHDWACIDLPITHPVGGMWTTELIEELVQAIYRRDSRKMQGISSPDALSCSNAIVHTTGTGRLQWRIDPAGRVGIAVCRPGEVYDSTGSRRSLVVLSACVQPNGSIEIRDPDHSNHCIPDVGADWSGDGGPRAEDRHGDALLHALLAIVDSAAAESALDLAGVPRTPPYSETTTAADEARIAAAGIAARASQIADCEEHGCTADGCADRAQLDAERDAASMRPVATHRIRLHQDDAEDVWAPLYAYADTHPSPAILASLLDPSVDAFEPVELGQADASAAIEWLSNAALALGRSLPVRVVRMDAEVPELAPGWEDRAVERAKREGVLPID